MESEYYNALDFGQLAYVVSTYIPTNRKHVVHGWYASLPNEPEVLGYNVWIGCGSIISWPLITHKKHSNNTLDHIAKIDDVVLHVLTFGAWNCWEIALGIMGNDNVHVQEIVNFYWLLTRHWRCSIRKFKKLSLFLLEWEHVFVLQVHTHSM